MKRRLVLDTNVVLSALLFRSPELMRLEGIWQTFDIALASRDTAAELIRVLNYPRFKLSPAFIDETLAAYLPYAEKVEIDLRSPLRCRDPKDDLFLDLATAGRADILVSGDADLLVLKGRTPFRILTPAEFLALP